MNSTSASILLSELTDKWNSLPVREGVAFEKRELVKQGQIAARNDLLNTVRDLHMYFLLTDNDFQTVLDCLDPETPLGDGVGTDIMRAWALFNRGLEIIIDNMGTE